MSTRLRSLTDIRPHVMISCYPYAYFILNAPNSNTSANLRPTVRQNVFLSPTTNFVGGFHASLSGMSALSEFHPTRLLAITFPTNPSG
jgi:hypothetical protein